MIKLSHNNKSNKKEAFNILLDAKCSTVPNQLSNNDIDSLINYFAPVIPKVSKSVEQWVAKAVAKKDVRFNLNYLHVKDSVIYGCDGSRIHWGKTVLKDGYYDPKTLLPVDCDKKYPDMNRVIDVNFENMYNESLKHTFIFGGCHCYLLNETNYQQSFINDAVNNNDSIVFHVNDTNEKLRGYSQFGEFIVMGMRDKNARS